MLGNGTSCFGVRTVRNGNGKANEDKKRKERKNSENTKRSQREHGSVKNSLTLPSWHASAKKKYIR